MAAMHLTSSKITTSVAAKAARLAGAAFAGSGVVQLVHRQDTGEDVAGVAGHLNIGFFLLAMLFLAPVFPVLARYATGSVAPKAARIAATGTAVLGLTCITSLVLSHDGPWFVFIAPITNAAWLFSSIALAVGLKRAGRLPAPIAIGLPLAWITTIPLSMFGGALLTGAYFMSLGLVLTAETEVRGAPEPALAGAR
jgi:hypothetical protein